jgi:hypothetical protein
MPHAVEIFKDPDDVALETSTVVLDRWRLFDISVSDGGRFKVTVYWHVTPCTLVYYTSVF